MIFILSLTTAGCRFRMVKKYNTGRQKIRSSKSYETYSELAKIDKVVVKEAVVIAEFFHTNVDTKLLFLSQ